MSGRVREFREAKGLSRAQLALRSRVSRPTLNVAEVDVECVRIETLIKLAKALDVTLDEIAPERAAEHAAALAEVS